MARQVLFSYEEPWYVAVDLATNVASQGETIQEAKNNLKEALALYFEDIPESVEKADDTVYFLGMMEVV